MPNLIVISSIIFPCMSVGLSVRHECERSVKNQALKVEQVDFATRTSGFCNWLASSSREVTREKVTCRAHDWKIKSHARLSISQLSRGNGQPTKVPQKSLFGKKLCFALPSLHPHYIYPHYL